jgi:SMC interacting uncharacterized protein involved in chromosome segregation
MLAKMAKFRVGEFVDVNHKGYPMQVTSCRYDYHKDDYKYFLNRVKDDAGFDAYEKELKTADTETLISALIANVNETTDYFLKASKEADDLRTRLKAFEQEASE